MNDKERAAMQQALEALRNVGNTVKYLIVGNSMSQMYGEMRDKAVNEANKAITALREALAEQAEQKPVSPYKPLPEEIWSKPFSSGAVSVPAQQAEPPVRTKDYNPDVIFNDDGTFSLTLPDGDELRIIPPQQEPTAEVSEEGYAWGKDGILPAGSLLYAAPVRTKDLTDDEILEITKRFALGIAFPVDGVTTPEMFARAVIAADREKNK